MFFRVYEEQQKSPVTQIFHNSLDYLRGKAHLRKKCALSRPRFVGVALGVKVERRLDAAVAEQARDPLRLGSFFISQLERVAEIFQMGDMTVVRSANALYSG